MKQQKSLEAWAFAAALVLFSSLSSMPLRAQGRGLEIQAKDGSRVGAFKASYALVIGESQYRSGWPKLPGVVTDVDFVTTALEEQGFAVTTRRDLSSDALKAAYEDFIGSHGLDEGNRLLFYYAGHGHTLKLAGGRDMGYIVPVDAPDPNEDPAGFKRAAIAMQQFDTWAKGIEARHALFLFDSCFSGSIFAISRAMPANINEKTLAAVRQFITSGSAEETVPDRSLFREQFLAGIRGEADRNGDGYVTGAELGEFLDEKVVNYSNASQHPQYGKIRDPALDKGDFVFAVPASVQTAPAALASVQAPSPAPAGPKVTVTKPRGSVVVTTASAGSLYLDGDLIAELPAGAEASIDEVEAGERSLEMRYEGAAPEKKSVTVQKNSRIQVGFTWKKAPQLAPVVQTAAGDMILVKGGSFQMGSSGGEADEKPVHEVRVSDFYIGKYEVTQAQYRSVTGKSPSNFKGDDLPVEQVNWYEALAFCNALSEREGLRTVYTISGTSVSADFSAKGYRLPTEAEWEYAARGGQAGIRQNVKYAGSDNLDQVAWYSSNSGGKTHPIGQKAPNALGLYDMSGNVWEWCWDRYARDFYSKSPVADPLGASSGADRVFRGGSWNYDAIYARSAFRSCLEPDGRGNSLGFRILRRP